MERIKSKVLKNSEQLKEECEAVQALLNRLLDKDKEAVQEIANLSDKDVIANKKYLLTVTEFQALAIQKLLEVGVELDEFSNDPHTLLHGGVAGTSVSKTEVSFSSINFSSDTSIPNKEFISDEKFVKLESTASKTGLNTNESKVEESVKFANLKPSDYAIKMESSHVNNKKASSPEKNKHKGVEIDNTESHIRFNVGIRGTERKKERILSQDSDIFLKESGTAVGVIKMNPDENDNESSLEDSNPANISTNKKSSADISSSEDIGGKLKGKGKTTQEKLKSKKLMTRRDRFRQTIQRPDIPDLSFRPTNKVFDSAEGYITCPESSSLMSNSKKKDEKAKRKRSSEKNLPVSVSNTAFGYGNPPNPVVHLEYLVAHIISPFEFYINRLDENIATIDAVSHQLIEIFKDTSSPFPDKKSAKETLGNHCVCYIDNYESWYRVTVTNWRLLARDYQEKLVTVFLVDYGHSYTVTFENLRELYEDFCRVPPCAIKCQLAWLYPPGSTRDTLLETWPKKSLDFFRSLFPKDTDCIYKVVYAEKCGNTWGIDLILAETDGEDVPLGQEMLANGMAVEIFQDKGAIFSNIFFVDQIKTAQGLAGITPKMTNEERLEKATENANIEYGSIDEAMLRYRATDEARTCKNLRPDGTCFKGKRCKWDHAKLRKDGVTTDKHSVYIAAFKELEMPETGAIVKLRVVNVVSINTFYACLVNYYSEGLKNLIKTMNNSNTISKYKRIELILAPGELVIAKNWNDSWYRAKVRDVYHFPQNSEETVQVFFVDLGDIVDLKMEDLRTMTAEFLHLPFQAILCRLYNVLPIHGQDQNDARRYAEARFLCQVFDAEVKYASSSTLEVLLRKEGNTNDVGEQIIEDGYGELRTRHEFPLSTESLLVD